MNVHILQPDSPEWMDALTQLRHDVYQLPQYLQLEADRQGTIPEAVLIQEDDKTLLIPYLLRRCDDVVPAQMLEETLYDAISPYGYPGLLLSDAAIQTPGFPDSALAAFKQNLKDRGVCSIFLRLHPVLNESHTELFAPGTLTENGETVSVDLRLENLWSPTRSGHRSTINKCKRLGMEAKIVPVAANIDEFVSIYEETMDRVNANPGYYEFDRAYFHKMHDLLGEHLHMCVVEHEGEMACAGLYTESGGIVQSALGGTRDKFVNLSPSSLETDFARYWAKERGNEFMHLGGGVGGSKEDCVYRFKAGFSKLRHPFYTLRMVVDETKYQTLTQLRAQHLGNSVSKLEATEFFPSYRAA
ncbi:GNAT family N-acetyltransferase [filamentous cyanobacterium LEGE 11480]|uniref:GNAT family N-acetyltransferase n=1 Tax=Romeriopsis navalis LEGE 11480 TaxID=2777977 RepID=A0A928VMG5_9CYAN|nr:GNAT family N-acetyltransferase [Romeriopsis navalis]MBE9028694.1 GNAT family N-acetyltransferase [Romeriopsis navalis LEGE 11480]